MPSPESSLEEQLETKLAHYQDIHRDFYNHRHQLEHLGESLFRLSGELGLLRYKISCQTKDQQLEAFDKDLYVE